MAGDTRERILAAVRTLLARGGPAAVTLDAAAAEAGVSKGGLLYHFPTKAALFTGVLAQMRDRVTADMAERTATSGPVRAFLEYGLPVDGEDAFAVALIAAVRQGQAADDETRALLVDGFAAWERPLLAAVDDPVRAEIIRLVGNGIYLSAISGLPLPDPALLAEVIDRLTDPATPPPGRSAELPPA
jgi:AcrR family transcriptional regulator